MSEQNLPPLIQQPAQTPAKPLGVMWKIIPAVNLLCGCFLWFISLTNNSLPGEIPNFIHPFVSGCIAIISLLLLLKKNRPHGWMKRFYILCCLPSLLRFGLACLTFPMMVYCVSTDTFKVLQRAVSPDRSHVAVVYYVSNPGPACASGSSVRWVSVHHRLLPFIERHVCAGVGSGPDIGLPDTREYIRWKDNDTLLVSKCKIVQVSGKYSVVKGKKIPHKETRIEFVEEKIPPIKWWWSLIRFESLAEASKGNSM